MEFVYALCGNEWEDMIILLSEDAINESIKHPDFRVEIFSKNKVGYTPTYYYKKGKLS